MANSQTDLPVVLLDGERTPPATIFGKLSRWWSAIRRLRMLKQAQDVTISFLPGANVLNALTSGAGKTIVSERGSKTYHAGMSRLTKFLWLSVLDPFIYRRVDTIVPASAGYATEILSVAGESCRNKIIPIEGTINSASLLDAAEAEVDADVAAFCSGPTVVYSGRVDYGKGLDLLVPAFARVRDRIAEVKFLIIGEGPLVKPLAALFAEHGFAVADQPGSSANVYFAGYRRNPFRHLRLGSLYVFPSLHEGLPNALIEAVASGVPILAADCPWGPRSILAGSGDTLGEALHVTGPQRLANGVLMPLPVSTEAVEIWAREIAAALATPRARRGLDERQAAIARFDIEHTGLKWLELARSLASGRGNQTTGMNDR